MIRGAGVATFTFGILSGVLLALIAEELWPSGLEADMAQYEAVRDFARESFVREVDDEQLVELALDGMLRGLDEYSRYYDKQQSRLLERETRGRFKGIGVIFRRPVKDGQVLYPLTGSPAGSAGVRVGDRFITVAGTPLTDLSESEFRALIGDPPGGVLEATVRGLDGDVRSVEIEPASIVDPTVRHGHLIDPERHIGYLAITSFSSETPAEFDRTFEFLWQRGARSFVLDLRGNLGGVLESAVAVARRFVPQGVIVSTEGRGTPIVYRADPAAARHEGTPLVVLVDGESASASEVLAGALQDHRAAVVVGAPTYGKGMVQTIRQFDRWESRAKVTTSYYYTPSGRHFERSADPNRSGGILPDVLVELTDPERAILLAFLQNYGPPPEAVGALDEWEAAEDLQLTGSLPADPQLDAALGLFEGRNPGPQPTTAK